ncbi:hypothetical protein [Pseudomonas sp. KU43P]|uniref:hypothetical protein n=1 Tax=Pseudomonas sp. KU43P TaxID=2487887 RepID=UPI0012A98AE8|nr:hypothetical protein [Pseudomonas sp. KU43P]BBH45286.1 hypothetical protein KU43P_17630 [Pseudomonas sp. KU43P]
MSVRRLELVSSLDLLSTVDSLHNGLELDFAQYSLLREAAEAKLCLLRERVKRRDARAPQNAEVELVNLQSACLRVAHLLQTSCLALRRLQLDYQDQCLAREALESQLLYMQACLRRSMSSFKSGQ